MSILLALLLVVVFACLVLATAMHPVKPRYSLSELRRRSKKTDTAKLEFRRYEARPALVTFLRTLRTVLLVITVVLFIAILGWLWGILAAIVLAIIYPSVARIPFVHTQAEALYLKLEPTLLDWTGRFKKILHAIREPSLSTHDTPRHIYSHEDLTELIQNSKEIVGENERTLLTSAFEFFGKKVSEVMTPRSMIDFIKKGEFLGPLVLDELHALGHSRLPVIDKDLDHIEGVLHLRDMLSLDVRKSTTAEKAMEAKVYYIHEDDSLEHALAAFLKTRHHLFVVINENRETVGLITLEDVIEALIGRQIVDEDDVHADLRAVASREGRANNIAPGHVDL